MTLEGRSALVTGASSGIGAAVAESLSAAGVRLVLTGTDSARLADIARRTGGTVLPADLRVPADLERVCQAAERVDLLIASAGRGWAGPLAEMPPALAGELVALNLSAPLRLARAALPGMVERGRGHLVFVSSIATVGVRDEAVYAASKAGLRAFAASLRYELAGQPVEVTAVLPGAVRTPFFNHRGRPYDRHFPRPVSPETVADALLRAVARNRAEVFVPSWLTVPARVNGLFPGIFHRLASRFG
jgi:short-subunit dehydrogenase